MALAVILFMIRQFVKSQRLRIAEGYKQIDAVREEIRNSKRFLISQKFPIVFSKSEEALLRMKAEKITPYKENFMIIAEVPTVRGIAEKLQIEFKEVEKGTMVVVHAKPVSKLPVGLDDLEGLKIIERYYTYLNESFLLLFPQSKSTQEGDKEHSLDKIDIEKEYELDRKTEDKYMQIKETEVKNIDDIQIKEVKNDFEKYREIYLRQKGNLPPKQKSSILDGNIDNKGLEKGLEKIGVEKENPENKISNDENEGKKDEEKTQEKSKDKLTETNSLDMEKSEMKIVDLAELRKKKG
ncbi:MAG: hypothetical protein QXT63_01210 [Thermoplasmata archaeon]